MQRAFSANEVPPLMRGKSRAAALKARCIKPEPHSFARYYVRSIYRLMDNRTKNYIAKGTLKMIGQQLSWRV